MKKLFKILTILLFYTLMFETNGKDNPTTSFNPGQHDLRIGWASADITPEQPIVLRGSLHARVSEGLLDPLTATVLAIESGDGSSSEKTIMISVDVVGIPDELRDNVRKLVKQRIPEIDPQKIILNATHTHDAPAIARATNFELYGVPLDAVEPKAYFEVLSEKLVTAAVKAWNSRQKGGISYGIGQAVVGHNRLQVNFAGKSEMYGNVNHPQFSHIEGYEDHSIQMLFTFDQNRKVSGVVINLAAPSQISHGWQITADYWHDTRQELKKRLGQDVFIYAQCSAAGDQYPNIMVGKKAEERMRSLVYKDIESDKMRIRKEIARRISDAATYILEHVKEHIEWTPLYVHQPHKVMLSKRLISQEHVDNVLIGEWHNRDKFTPLQFEERYKRKLKEVQDNPSLKQTPRWYVPISHDFTMVRRANSVRERYELQKTQSKIAVEVHVLRIGDIVMATNPFELYLDYGMRIKAQSPATQTFLVQLAGNGTYIPTERSIAGGSYGATPTSTIVGAEGGQELVESTLKIINDLWEK